MRRAYQSATAQESEFCGASIRGHSLFAATRIVPENNVGVGPTPATLVLVKAIRTDTPSRGTAWVVMQFTLMLALLAAAPIWRAQWSGWLAPAMGVVLLFVGGWIGVRGGRDLGSHRTPFPRPKEDGQLVTSGVYAQIRHPLYAAVIVLGFAWVLLWRSEPALALAVLQVPFFDAKARREERWLRERFPEYSDYMKRVKRFIPGLY
jgi:protein-S-isoprenylcysteine O-methyltransferase Ste14